MTEETLYTDDNVQITTSRIIMGSTTYALRNITSVKMAMTPAKRGCATTLLLFGGFWLMMSLGEASDASGILLPLIVSVLAGIWLSSCRPDYHLAIASSSGEVRALTSRDKVYIERIVASVNDAIVACR